MEPGARRRQVATVKPSVNAMRGWTAAVSAAALCAVAVAGCSSGSSASAPLGGSLGPLASPAGSAAACRQWAGLDDLDDMTTWLRQMIGDVVLFGADTAQARRDSAAVVRYAQSLGGISATLPAQYARELRGSVLPVVRKPAGQSPEQLNAAANQAQSLGQRIGNLCF